VSELNTPTKTLEVQKERMDFSNHDHAEDYDARKGSVATPIKTPRPCLAASPLLDPSEKGSNRKTSSVHTAHEGSTNSRTDESQKIAKED
jgi:hypothetical protein